MDIGSRQQVTVTSIGSSEILVCLPQGDTGVISRAECRLIDADVNVHPGDTLTVEVTKRVSVGRFTVVPCKTVAPRPADTTFDREVAHLNHMLNDRPARTVGAARETANGQLLLEQQLQEWIDTVDGSLLNLKKHRRDRLRQEFYNQD